MAALRHNKMVAPMVVEGALAYVENCELGSDVSDATTSSWITAGSIWGPRTAAIETVGATLRYLPKYSPDLNPIEMP